MSALEQRPDFRATRDPALDGRRSPARLLDYRQLYALWERQQWSASELDFARDRSDWWERIPPEERSARMHGLASFFIGEQRVAAELGPIMRAVPDEEMRLFLCTQIADEARHVVFFDRFHAEVGVLDAGDLGQREAGDLGQRLAGAGEHVNSAFKRLFDELLPDRVERLVREPQDVGALVEAVTLYHIVIEGMLALTGQHFIIEHNTRIGTLPTFVDGLIKVARDEHRHVAFGARLLSDMVARSPELRVRVERMLAESVPIASEVLRPKWMAPQQEDEGFFGFSVSEVRAFALQALQRRLRAIGLG